MQRQNGIEYIFNEIKESGYQGTVKDLGEIIRQSRQVDNINQLLLNIRSIKEHNCDADKKHLVEEFEVILNKLFKKYNCSIHNPLESFTIYFRSNKKTKNNESYLIMLDFEDNTTLVSNGYYGEAELRVLYGFEDRRREFYVTFKDRKKYS